MMKDSKPSQLVKVLIGSAVVFSGLWLYGTVNRPVSSSSIASPQSTEVKAAPVVAPVQTETKPVTSPAPSPVPTPVAAPTEKSNCDPNYSGCVPNVYPSDVDCASGSGNGPYYTSGPVRVIGTDHYGLDRDGDRSACE